MILNLVNRVGTSILAGDTWLQADQDLIVVVIWLPSHLSILFHSISGFQPRRIDIVGIIE